MSERDCRRRRHALQQNEQAKKVLLLSDQPQGHQDGAHNCAVVFHTVDTHVGDTARHRAQLHRGQYKVFCFHFVLALIHKFNNEPGALHALHKQL